MTDRFGPQRLIIVDDNDKSTNITYTGGWSLDNTGGEWNGVGDNGNPFRSTLHKTTTTSSVTFRFKGPSQSTSYSPFAQFQQAMPSGRMAQSDLSEIRPTAVVSAHHGHAR